MDEPTSCLVMHRTEPSSLQSLSLQLADKLYNLVDNNERVLDQKPFFPRGVQVCTPFTLNLQYYKKLYMKIFSLNIWII